MKTEPRLTAETPPADITTVAQLHEIARALDRLALSDDRPVLADLAAMTRAAIASYGVETVAMDEKSVALDEVAAAATLLSAHAPDVMVPARETGDRLLRLVGEQR